MKTERFPHKPYINEDFPKNVTAVLYSNVTFKCPIVSDTEPFMQWVRVADYPGDLEDTPKGELLQVYPLLQASNFYIFVFFIHKIHTSKQIALRFPFSSSSLLLLTSYTSNWRARSK